MSGPINIDLVIKMQKEDLEISKIIEFLNSKNVSEFNNWITEENILLCTKKIHNTLVKRLVVPKSMIETVLTSCHDDISGGHLGFKKTWPKIRDRFYWKTMYEDTVNWVKSCKDCAARKTPPPKHAPLIPINKATKPFEMVGVDILGPITTTYSGNKYILVFTDYLTRWPEAFAIKNIEAKTVAKVFVKEIIARHSAPSHLLSDRGTQFLSSIMKEVCNFMQINKLTTTAYHPQTNGLTERFNKTLCSILSQYIAKNQKDWDEMLSIALFAYRASVHETTLTTPFELLYGRMPRLPSDLSNFSSSTPLITDINKAWKDTNARIAEVNKSRKAKHDEQIVPFKYKIGEKVRLKVMVNEVGKSKKLNKEHWKGPYEIVEVKDNNNIIIRLDNGTLYTTHQERVKLAECERIINSKPKKQVRFAEPLVINAETASHRNNMRYNLRPFPKNSKKF
jgi:hypothetical protein